MLAGINDGKGPGLVWKKLKEIWGRQTAITETEIFPNTIKTTVDSFCTHGLLSRK